MPLLSCVAVASRSLTRVRGLFDPGLIRISTSFETQFRKIRNTSSKPFSMICQLCALNLRARKFECSRYFRHPPRTQCSTPNPFGTSVVHSPEFPGSNPPFRNLGPGSMRKLADAVSYLYARLASGKDSTVLDSVEITRKHEQDDLHSFPNKSFWGLHMSAVVGSRMFSNRGPVRCHWRQRQWQASRFWNP